MMSAFISGLWTAFMRILPTVAGKLLLSLGIGYATYSGVDTLASAARSELLDRITGSGAVIVQLAGVLQVGTCINIFVSAILAKLLVAGITNGAITKFVTKG